MKTALIVLALLLLGGFILMFVLGVISRSGSPPGLVQGRLMQCPDSPNCVCSEFPDDRAHYVDPLKLSEVAEDAIPDVLKEVVLAMGGRIQIERSDYLAATFSSGLFGFVDDLEFRVDAQGDVLHLRSASRVGHGDLGVNRKRVERLERLLVGRRPSYSR